MGTLLAVVFLGLALGAGLLAIPLELAVHYRSDEDAAPQAEVVWLFGVVRRELRPGAGGESKPRKWPPFARLRELWDEGLGERVGHLFRALRRVVDLRDLFLHARLGTGDPAETGMLMGVVQPLRAAFLAAFPDADFNIEPDFAEATAQVDASGSVRVVPLSALPPLLRFALSPVTLRTFRTLRASRP